MIVRKQDLSVFSWFADRNVRVQVDAWAWDAHHKTRRGYRVIFQAEIGKTATHGVSIMTCDESLELCLAEGKAWTEAGHPDSWGDVSGAAAVEEKA